MGVRGLSTFVTDNQGSICKTVTLEQRRDGDQTERIPVIVDAWGLIFQLWLSSLPWTSGGEYLRYYRLVHRLIAAWRSVGLEPIFIFDGSAPNSKIETILSRLDEQLRTARIFYTASPASRSEPSFSKSCGKQLLPPLASQTFIHAVHDAQAEAHFVPVGEADGACVSLAEERGAYVFGLDSDYFVLVGSAGLRGVRGYCPTDMMQWVDGDEAGQPGQSGGSGGAGDGWSMPRQFGRPPYNNGPRHNGPNTDWSTAGPRARPYKQRQSQLLPPSDARSPSLILRVVTPAALRARLRIPPQMMPLFGALIGNDHTPAIAADHFFEPGLHSSQKVDKAARAIREVVFAPKPRPAGPINAGAVSSTSGTSTPNGSDAGDHAYLLVKRIMARLAWKPFLTENIQTEVMEAIIEATVEYALPFLAKCCDEYPFCGEMVQAGGCENAAKAWAEDEAEPHTPTPISGTARARRAYAAAQKKGLLNHATHVYMYPHRVLLWAVMEDPAGPSLKAEAGAVALRTAAYGYVEEALGGLIWERATKDVEEDTEAQQDVPESDRVMTEEEENAAATRLLDSDTVDETANGKSTTDADIQPEGLERLSTETEIVPKRHIIEFVRHTNRHAPFRLDLPPITSAPHTPMAIAPLTNRLQAFLAPLHSATPLILALPPCLQPLAAYVRYCIIETAIRASRSRSSSSSPNSGSDARWTGGEVTAILKGGVGSFACWSREKVALSKPASSKAAGQEEPVAWPELSTRNSHLLSQLGSIMTDSLYLAQALLLLPDTELEEGMQGSPMGVKRKVSGTGSADGPSGGDTGGSGDPVDQRKSGAGNGPDAAVPVNTNGNASSHSQGIPPIAGKTRPSLPRSRSEARMPNLTHLTPFVFFSGINLHMLLRGEIPPGWQWSERDEKLLQTLLSAVREGLPDGTVRGWTTQRSLGVGTGAIDGTNGPEVNGYGVTGSGESHSRVTSAASDGTAMSDSSFLIDEGSEGSKAKKGKKKKGANGINGKAGQVPAGNAKGGRFDILASSVA